MPGSRKKFIQQIGAGFLLTGIPQIVSAENLSDTILDPADFEKGGDAADEQYWKKIAHKYYVVSKDYINLENGYYGIQPKPVLQAFQKNITTINAGGARFARKVYPEQAAAVKKGISCVSPGFG